MKLFYVFFLMLLCYGPGVPDVYPPESAKGANGPEQPLS